MSDILAFAEQRDGILKKGGLEAIAAARLLAGKTGGRVKALLLGKGLDGLLQPLIAHGADEILAADHPQLEKYRTDAYTPVASEQIRKARPAAVLFPASAMGKDLSANVAAELETGLATDCTEIDWDGGALVIRRPVYAGKAVATMKVLGTPPMASLRPHAYSALPPDPGREGGTKKIEIFLDETKIRARLEETVTAKERKADLTEAEIIVSGGRGMKGPEHYKLLEELAGVLGGVVGSSRAVCDAGWRPHSEQVGQTGKTVSPNLYFAIGISGAIQHLAGMSTSKVIVAINTDRDAPIFQAATYGIVGDLFQIVPALTQALKKYKG
jgi:electron transfer flavoprotein alpha subunit